MPDETALAQQEPLQPAVRRYALKTSAPSRKGLVDYDRDLSEEQRAVALCDPRPTLVIAGAGSGKTRALTYRVAHLLETGTPPEKILLLTFTNKAAREMMARVGQLCRVETRRMWGGTFHHVAHGLLREHASRLGYADRFGLLDREDAKEVMASATADLGYGVGQRRFPRPDALIDLYSTAVNTQRPLAEVIATEAPQVAALPAAASDHELPEHAAHPRPCQRVHLLQPQAVPEGAARAPRGRGVAGAGAAARRASASGIRRPAHPRAARGRHRAARDGGALPGAYALDGAADGAGAARDSLPGSRRCAVLRAGAHQGRARAPQVHPEPAGRALLQARRQACARDRRRERGRALGAGGAVAAHGPRPAPAPRLAHAAGAAQAAPRPVRPRRRAADAGGDTLAAERDDPLHPGRGRLWRGAAPVRQRAGPP